MRFHPAVIVALSLATGVSASAGPERNVNMVSGTGWPGGDPFLQRQNEPSIAVSTRNPLHLLAGANDYRTVDVPGLPEGKVIGDAWLGVFRSYDGGNTWTSTLLPGYPQDTSAAGMASPLKGYPAGADPVVRGGANGIFYYAGITLTRDENPLGALFVARYLDYNDKESSHLATEEAHAIRYVDTTILQQGTSGQFMDKPWFAVDIPRAGSAPCTVGGQTVDGGNLYMAWTILVGGDENIRSKMMVTRSTNCGATWEQPTKLSESHAINQGASVAIDPANGNVYVVWRRIRNDKGETDALLFAKSTDFGATFSKTQVLREITPFEQGTSPWTFRTTMFPSMTVDGHGRIHIVWSQRNAEWRGRVTMMTSADGGTTWSDPVFVANDGLGHQFMPTIHFAHGKLTIGWYDQTEDHTRGLYTPILDGDKHTGQYTETRELTGHLAAGKPEEVFLDFIIEFGATEPLLRRHTLDVWVAQAELSLLSAPVFQKQRASRYYFGSRPTPNPLTGKFDIEQMQFNPPNLPLFLLGTTPFMGDYIDLTAGETMSKESGVWQFATQPSKTAVRHIVWTDNRDVRPPPKGKTWADYTPAGSTGGTSLFDPAQTSPQCVEEGLSGMRNQNIYTTRVTDGLWAGSPGNTKPFFDEFGEPLKRAFVVFVQNPLLETKTYRLQLLYDAPQTIASFLQFSELPIIYVSVPPRSTVARTVFAVSGLKYDTIHVEVDEVALDCTDPESCPPLADGLSTVVILNPDIANPDIANPDIANPDIANPDIANAEVYNPDIANPDIANPDIANPDIANPDIANPDIANPDIANPDIANPDIANPDIANGSLQDGEVTDTTWEMTNEGNTTASYSVNLLLNGEVPEGFKLQLILHRIYTTPIAKGCNLEEERHTVLAANINNPEFTPAEELVQNDVTDSSEKNATIYALPGETVRLTLRVLDPNRFDDITFNAAEQVAPIVFAHAVNTLDAEAGIRTPSVALTVMTFRVPDAISGAEYSSTLEAIGGRGAYSWSVTGGALPPGIALDPVGTLAGLTTSPGTYSFTATASDGAGHSDEQIVRFDVVEPLEIPEQELPDGLVGTAYDHTLTRTGGTGPFAWSISAGALPAGLTLSKDGVISGTPETAGTSEFSVSVQDGTYPAAQVASRALSIVIASGEMFLAFVEQPSSSVEGTSETPIVVQASDAEGSPIPGVVVTLTAGQNPCSATSASSSGTTDEAGRATLTPLPLDACYGYTYLASGEAVGFRDATAESNAFDVYGFGHIGNLPVGRGGHTATLLADGKVLLIGGRDQNFDFVSEIATLDPATGDYDVVGEINIPRWLHTATLLRDGTVLITGGQVADNSLTSDAAVFDPAANILIPVEPMAFPRRGHTATARPDGTVVIVGGAAGEGGATVELYDEGLFEQFSTPLAETRLGHTATLIGDNVVIAGGSIVEIVTAANTIVSGGKLNVARGSHTATLLDDGRILLAGGSSGGNPVRSTEIYNIATRTSTPAAAMNVERSGHFAARLADGTVVLAGGFFIHPDDGRLVLGRTVELYVPASDTFLSYGSLSFVRSGVPPVVLPSGTIIAIGGTSAGPVRDIERFFSEPFGTLAFEAQPANAISGSPVSDVTVSAVDASSAAASELAVELHFMNGSTGLRTVSGTTDSTGRAHFSDLTARGGYDYALRAAAAGFRGATSNRFDIYGFGDTPPLPVERSGHTATLLRDRRVFVAGGRDTAGNFLSSTALYDPRTGTWSAGPDLGIARFQHAAVLTNTGTVLITGGIGVTAETVQHLVSTEVFDPIANSITPGDDLWVSRRNHTATARGGEEGTVVIVGGENIAGPLAAIEIFDGSGTKLSAAPDDPARNLQNARAGHTATRIGNTIAIIGGTSAPFTGVGPVELIKDTADPAVVDVVAGGNLLATRFGHSAMELNDARILVTGGQIGTIVTATAEVYDPGTGLSTETGSMATPRMEHASQILLDGTIVVAGGVSLAATVETAPEVTDTVEVYDPSSRSFVPFGTLSSVRRRMAVVPLVGPLRTPGLLVVGGETFNDSGFQHVATAEPFWPRPVPLTIVFDPLTDAIVGQPYFSSLHAIGGVGPRGWNVVSGSLPPGISLSPPGTLPGSLSGTPTAAGTYTFTARVSDAASPANTESQEYSLRVVEQLVLPDQAVRNATLGVSYSESLVVRGGTAPYSWRLASGALPPGLSLSADGVISGTCTATGGYSFTPSVSDGTYPVAQDDQRTLSMSCDNGVLEFITQPADAVSGEPVTADLVVRSRDTSGFALAGIAVTLAVDEVCESGFEPATVSSDANGEAHFGSITISRGCYDYAFNATSPNFSPRLSNLFDVFGFGSFAPTNAHRHNGFTATTLLDGRVLVTGGNPDGDAAGTGLASAEIFDPETGTWSAVEDMNLPRQYHTATLLSDGSVLIAGGRNGTVRHTELETFNPATATFEAAGSLNEGRFLHTETRLPDGTVLLIGGVGDEGQLNTAEIYDPESRTSTSAGSMSQSRDAHTATLLADGRVVVTGGGWSEPYRTVEVYADGAFTSGPTLTYGRLGSTATLLPDGRILVVGGSVDGGSGSGVATTVAEIFDPNGELPLVTLEIEKHIGHAAEILDDDNVIIAGGGTDAVELFEPSAETFTDFGSIAITGTNLRSARLTSLGPPTPFIVIGGSDGTGMKVEVFYPPR